jgi:hypothetical protein
MGLIYGILVGVLIGPFTGHLAIWLGLGVSFGLLAQVLLDANEHKVAKPENRRGRADGADPR